MDGEEGEEAVKVVARCAWLKRKFGRFLRDSRLGLDMSVYDIGYVLGLSHATVYYWEEGKSFPNSVMKLKQLQFLYGGVMVILRGLFDDVVTRTELRDFLREVASMKAHIDDVRSDIMWYEAKDKRDDSYRRAFGRYLAERRQDVGVSANSLAVALGMSHTVCYRWESGSSFPSDPVVLAKLDRLYGDTLAFIFGACPSNNVLLSQTEKHELSERMDEFSSTGRWEAGKPMPAGWAAYMERRRQ